MIMEVDKSQLTAGRIGKVETRGAHDIVPGKGQQAPDPG